MFKKNCFLTFRQVTSNQYLHKQTNESMHVCTLTSFQVKINYGFLPIKIVTQT